MRLALCYRVNPFAISRLSNLGLQQTRRFATTHHASTPPTEQLAKDVINKATQKPEKEMGSKFDDDDDEFPEAKLPSPEKLAADRDKILRLNAISSAVAGLILIGAGIFWYRQQPEDVKAQISNSL